ncbi:MAG TPA: hypothetical protein VI029_16215, partial [Mycobacterium sp.]
PRGTIVGVRTRNQFFRSAVRGRKVFPTMEYFVEMTTHVPVGTPEQAVDATSGRQGSEFLTTLDITVPDGTSGRWSTT